MRQQIATSKALKNCLKVPIAALPYKSMPHGDMPSMHAIAQTLTDHLGLVVSDDFSLSPFTEKHDGNGTPPLGSGVTDWEQADYDRIFTDYDGCDILTGTDGAMPNDWHGPFMVRGATGHHNSLGFPYEATAVVFVGTHSVDCVDGDIIAYSLWLAIPDVVLLLSDARGQYIPRDFVQDCVCIENNGSGQMRPTDDGTGMCRWVPGTFRDASGPAAGEPLDGYVCDFYADDNVDTCWQFSSNAENALLDCLDPDNEWYWDSWDTVMRVCKARLHITGTLCDGTFDVADYDVELEQNGDLWALFSPRLR